MRNICVDETVSVKGVSATKDASVTVGKLCGNSLVAVAFVGGGLFNTCGSVVSDIDNDETVSVEGASTARDASVTVGELWIAFCDRSDTALKFKQVSHDDVVVEC